MKQPQYSTALYMRLSRDDESFGDSVSIETQRTVLTQYVREHPEFHVVSEFVDDGWSGTNFDRQVLCPGWFQYSRNGGCARFFEGQPDDKRYVWSKTQIKNILKDETYIGNTVHHRQGTVSYKNKRVVRNPQEKWLRVEGTHEAIIGKDVFETVQQQIASRRRECKDHRSQIFAGLLKCADCGWSMRYGVQSSARNPYAYYKCGKYSDFQTRGCTTHYIRYDALYAYVLARIQHWSARAIQDEDRLLDQLLSAGNRERNTAQKKQAAELKKATRRKAEIDGLFAKLYEDWVAGRITEYNFNMLTTKYQTEQGELAEKIDNLTVELDTVKQTESDARKWIDLIRQYADPTELTAPLLNALIEKILVHQSVKGEDGEQEQEIEIFYRFIGKID